MVATKSACYTEPSASFSEVKRASEISIVLKSTLADEFALFVGCSNA